MLRPERSIRRIFCAAAPAATTFCYLRVSAATATGLLSVACAMRASRAMCYGSRRGDMSRLSRSWNGHSFHGYRLEFRRIRRNMSLTCRYVRAAYRNRTDDLRITRGPLPGRAPASCTDSTGNRIDGTRRAWIVRRPGPRTGPRPRPCVPAMLLLHVNVADDMDPHPEAEGAGAAA